MSVPDVERLRQIKTLPSLVEFLRDELGWPADLKFEEDPDDLFFEFTADEIGLPPEFEFKTRRILQMRPLVSGQPWAVFYVEFEPKRLPVTALRRVLNFFVEKKRAASERATWKMQDLLFINAHGGGDSRGMTFAHFTKPEAGYTAVMREFMWDDRETHFAHIQCYLECLRWPKKGVSQQEWREQWRSAFVGSKRKAIHDSRTLAEEMAIFARDVRRRVAEVLEIKRRVKNDPARRLYETFKKVLVHDLTEEDFADMYAQTMAYGLFTARASRPRQVFSLKDAADAIPETNPFLRDLFRQCFGLSRKGGGKLDLEELGLARLVELFESLTAEDMRRILDEFGSQTGDPVIHFYEGFLHAYDAQIREMRGVYYTPDPVVSYIVRSVHEILKTDFQCPLGLADTSTWAEVAARKGFQVPDGVKPDKPFVRILDPACGTGTFLKHVIQLIHETMQGEWEKEKKARLRTVAGKADNDPEWEIKKWDRYVDEHLLPRLYAFELLPAPYAVCHMKLGLYLRDLNYQFKTGRRLKGVGKKDVEPPGAIFDADIDDSMAREAEDANRAKRGVPFTVVLGNPPYSGHSANTGPAADWIAHVLRGQEPVDKGFISTGNYFEVDGAPLGERNPKWLNDDYVKFIRYAHWRTDKTGLGILAFITNHGYLDNPTFRGMRQSLMASFDDIYVLDLHGNAKKKETALDGSKDENVFDIQQGVAICLMVKKS